MFLVTGNRIQRILPNIKLHFGILSTYQFIILYTLFSSLLNVHSKDYPILRLHKSIQNSARTWPSSTRHLSQKTHRAHNTTNTVLLQLSSIACLITPSYFKSPWFPFYFHGKFHVSLLTACPVTDYQRRLSSVHQLLFLLLQTFRVYYPHSSRQ